MAIEDSKLYIGFKKHQKIISLVEGILIILLLVMVWTSFFNSEKLQDEISENCGWGEEDYYCYCEKGRAAGMKNEMEGQFKMEVEYVSLVG